jgi:hypothetical protein
VNALPWSEFARAEPELAAHVEERLGRAPCYLGTVRPDGWPRVHPVGPLAPRDGCLVVTMYPTSPKGKDLRRNGRYALHGAVENTTGGGGEVLLTGTATGAEPSAEDRAKGYVLFELLIAEIVATVYDGADLQPVRRRWHAPA